MGLETKDGWAGRQKEAGPLSPGLTTGVSRSSPPNLSVINACFSCEQGTVTSQGRCLEQTDTDPSSVTLRLLCKLFAQRRAMSKNLIPASPHLEAQSHSWASDHEVVRITD